MKKVLSLVAVVALAASFTSCTKEYTCDCTVEGWDDWYDWTAEYKKADAEEACDATEAAVQAFDANGSCELM